MATIEDLEKRAEEYKEKLHENPLLKLTLGELISEMQKLYAFDPNVVKPEDQVPESSRENYERYNKIIKEIALREREYISYKPEPSF
jgi:hypothetical protein